MKNYDLIVWKGIISTYGNLKALLTDNSYRLATINEHYEYERKRDYKLPKRRN